MHVPGLHSAMLAVDPEGLAARIRRHVVIAAHFVAIPPSRLDSLRARDQFERTLAARIALQRDEALWAMQQPRGTKTANRSRDTSPTPGPAFFRPVVAGDRDAEYAILPQARSQALEEPFAIEGLLASAGKPRRLTRHIGKQRFGTQVERERGRREGKSCELLARDGQDETGFTLGRSEVEHHACARLAPVLEHEREALHARAARSH